MPWTAAAIAHGGVGSPPELADGVRQAVDAALLALENGAAPEDAVVAGVSVLEDDPRFNAGTGSRIRIDGETVQMDASVMTSGGRFGAVAGVVRVQNPVQVARGVMDTPHLLLAGDGATHFARTLGLPDYDPRTPEMHAKTASVQAQLLRDDPRLPEDWRRFDWRAHWNFERTIDEAWLRPPKASAGAGAGEPSSDTVGVAVRTRDGHFAVALSTGGTSITLRGRVGDVPILGAGLFASPMGAIAATGVGERIIEAGLARTAAGWMAEGATAQAAADRAVQVIKAGGAIGVIVISANELAAAADRPMAWAARESGSGAWIGSKAPPRAQ